MARKLFTVEDVFTLRERGIILVPGLVPEGNERFHIGDPLRLIRPDASEVTTVITGLNFSQREYPVLVALTKSEVPVGTEVWSL